MKKLAQKLISTGADLSTKNALKATLHFLGINPQNIDKLYIELKNNMYEDRMKRIPNNKKLIFLPQCLRVSDSCKATLGKEGWVCAKCSAHGKCKIYAIKEEGKKRGYEVFVVPGGSMVKSLIKEKKPTGVIGIACIKELIMAAEELKIPIQGIELSKDGCVNTDVDIKNVLEKL